MTVDPAGPGAPMSERMQSLLSRAAEDQLAEQRQLAGALTELRTQLQHIAAEVGSLRESSPGAGGSAEAAVASVSADIREAVRLLAERLDGVARLVQQRGSDLAELSAATSALQAAVRGHGEALAGVGNGLAALPSFGERIGGLQDNLSALHERLAGLEELSASIGGLQQRVESVDHGLRELRSAFAAVGARMAELPGRAELDAAAARSTAPLAGLTERLDALASTLAALPETLAAGSGPDGPDLDALHAQLERMAAAQLEAAAATRDRVAALEEQLAEVLAALTPDEEELADEDAEALEEQETEDPVLAEIAELREALLGEGGIAERLGEVGDDDLDVRVASAVQDAVAATEERLSAHIDEAVLALAGALLRRRTGRSGGTRAPSAVEDEVPSTAEDEVSDEDSDEGVDVDEDAQDEAPPWQTPPGAAGTARDPGAADETGSSTDADRRRRPWWRPGD